MTPDLVREVASHIKDDKTDPTFTSPQTVLRMAEMFGSLSIAIKSFLIHGHVTVFLLLATLVPIIKDKLPSMPSRTILSSTLT